MKIGIDARLYSQTGVGVYIRNLLHYLQRLEHKITFNVYLMDKDYEKVSFENKNFVKIKADFPWHSFSEQSGFLKRLNKDNLDLMHFTYFSYPVFYKKPFIATVHDLTPLFFKTGRASTKNSFIYNFKHAIFKLILKKQIKDAQAIITPTQTVKEQIVAYYGKSCQDKIYSIYEGVNYELMKNSQNNILGKKFSKPFFIYVGNFYPHKNVGNLIKAFAKIKEGCQLILIGPKDYFSSRLLQSNIKLECDRRIVFYHQSNLDDLTFFYKNAKALIHPSLSEGFGLPIIEAAYFNCPVIASNIGVFKELLGDKFIPFDQNDCEDIRKKIEAFIANPIKFDYQKVLEKFSFEQMAKKTLEIYSHLKSV